MVVVGQVDIKAVLFVQCDKWSKLDEWLFLLGNNVGDVHFDLKLPSLLHLGNHHLPIQGCSHRRGWFVLSHHVTVSTGDVPLGVVVFREAVFFQMWVSSHKRLLLPFAVFTEHKIVLKL